jgi:hypothetical protein
MPPAEPTEVPVAVRAWTTHGKRKKRPGAGGYDHGPSAWSLTFDTETTLDPGQALRVGAYQLRRRARLHEEGIFYEPAALTDTEIKTLRLYAAAEGIVVRTREEFAGDVFLRTACDRRGLIIGHNLPFDLSRISIANRPAQSRDPSMRGGFTLTLSRDPTRSHIQVKRINAGGAFIRLTIPSGISPEKRNQNHGGRTKNHHGYFLDTATLGGALLGGRPSLKLLGKLLQTETRKGEGDHGKKITPEYLGYMRIDVQATCEASDALRKRYDTYGLPKQAWEIYSEAGIGKAHLQKIGLTPFRSLNDWSDPILAAVMETYHGGCTGCAIRRTAVPGVYVDFTSQYPTAYCLEDLHRYLIAERVDWRYEDPSMVQALLDDITVDGVLDRALWPTLDALVLIAPDGDRLPTRTRYARRSNKRAARNASRAMNVGVPYRTGGSAQWYALADAVDSRLKTGKAPKVLKVLRFQPGPPQDGLLAIDIAGNPVYRVDPNHEDFIARLVEMRADVKDARKSAKANGDKGRAEQLKAIEQAMKATANSSAYGSPIEMNPIEHRKGQWVTVHHPHGGSFPVSVSRTERVGRWFHPLIATLVAAGGRLLLGAAMRLVADQGGHYAFCDTDSLFIVASKNPRPVPCIGGTSTDHSGKPAIQSLSWEQVDEIVGRFRTLNPYTTIRGSILEIEGENYDPDTGEQREIECLAIASKRYALFTRNADGAPRLIASGDKLKRSEHGLGHLLPPLAPNPNIDDRAWMDEWWTHILHIELGFEHIEPPWFDEPAIGRVTVTSPRDLKTFKTFNATRPYPQQVKPWGFLCLAHPAPHERSRPDGPGCLIAPFERDPATRRVMPWIDRDHPDRPSRQIDTALYEIRDEHTTVLSYRDYFDNYRRHPEAKALDPTDKQPCHGWTRGLLQPRHITATELRRVGKESNRLSETELALDEADDAVIEYPAPTRKCRGCDERVTGRKQWHSEACRKRATRAGAPRTAQAIAGHVS